MSRPPRLIPGLCALALGMALAARSPAADLVFREAASDLGLGPAHRSGSLYGPGISAIDFDLDGDLDLYLIDDQLGNRLLRNDGGTLVEVAAELGLALRPDGVTEPHHPAVEDIGGMMPCFVDLDNDGDRDFFLTFWQRPVRTFRNDGGHFVELTHATPLLLGNSATAAFGDYDRDGYLDIYVCDWGEPGHLLRNGRSLSFSDVSGSSGIWDIPLTGQPGWSAQWFYCDSDLAPELYVSMDYGFPNLLYLNLGNSFLERSQTWFLPGQNAGASMGQAFGDFDHDGDEDLYIANTGGNDFYRREGGGYVNLFATPDPRWTTLKEKKIGWYVDWIDFDNDTWLDLFLVLGYIPLCAPTVADFPYGCDPPTVWRQRNRMWRNLGDGFVDASQSAGIDDPDFGRGAARADFDLDGDIDLIVTNNNGPTRFYWNETQDVGNWLNVRLRGTVSNADGYGARLYASADGLTQERTYAATAGYLSQPADEVHFGLGSAAMLDSLRILWPSGLMESYRSVPTRRRIELREGSRASNGPQLPSPPLLSGQSRSDGVELSVQLGSASFDRVRILRVARGQWAGVVAELPVQGSALQWLDTTPQPNSEYRYLVEGRANGNWIQSDPIHLRYAPPLATRSLTLQIAPNPFNPGAKLDFEAPGAGPQHVEISIYDLAGRRLRVLVQGLVDPGPHSWNFDGRDADGRELPSGMYLLRYAVDGYEAVSRKVTLLR